MHDNLLDLRTHFEFGRNWLDYAEKIDDGAIDHAVAALRRLLGDHGLENRSFLDIGCGSGLHSLAALRLGARTVCGVDLDPNSVAAATQTIQRFARGADATLKVCSVFDMTSAEFGGFDVVYSWGVLHHTGDMMRAIKIAASLVKPEGELCIALYKRTPLCPTWRIIKRWYSRANPNAQGRARAAFTSLTKFIKWLKGLDFEELRREYSGTRGMDFENDQHDWLGGYPYESIAPAQCRALVRDLGFVLEREFIQPTGHLSGITGSGCDEYVFKRPAH